MSRMSGFLNRITFRPARDDIDRTVVKLHEV
jgi:hypothetical protein